MLLLWPSTGVTFSGAASRHAGADAVTLFKGPVTLGFFRGLSDRDSGMNVR